MENEKKQILLVDDDEIHLSVAEAILGNEYQVMSTKSGKEALDYMMRGPVPDLVLLDILMPRMDGWETFNRLKAISLLRDVPIAFLTSVDGAAEKIHAQEIGAADYITKPFEREALLKRVKAIFTSHNVLGIRRFASPNKGFA